MSLKFWGVRDEGKMSSILENCSSFEGSFLHIFMGKKKEKLEFPYIVASALKS